MSFLQTLASTLFGGKDTGGARPATARRGEELRRVRRVPQRMRSGFLWAETLISPRACMIKDLSISGARIDVLGEPVKPGLLADGVRLYFDTEKHEIPCTVAWMKGRMMGLKFEGRPRPPSRRYK